MNSPFFSIILSIYGVEKYLDRCINSILSQNFEDYELILVDDGSKDKCPEMCDEWARKDARIRVIHKINEGLGKARNTGMDAACGTYILFLDSDDYILPGLLRCLRRKLMDNPSDIVFYGFKRVDENGKEIGCFIPHPEKNYYSNVDEIKNSLLPDFLGMNPETGIVRDIRISAWNCCIRIDVLKDNNLSFVSERLYISEDIYFYIDLFPYLRSVQFVNEAYYCYCQNTGSLTFTYRKDRAERIEQFYIDATKRADELGYNGCVQVRLRESLIATMMSCLKMEAGNSRKDGIVYAYRRIKTICDSPYFRNQLNECSFKYRSLSWKVFRELVMHRWYRILLCALYIQYKNKGV